MKMSCSPTVLYVCRSQVVSQQEKVEQLESALQEQQQLLTVQVQASRAEVSLIV